MKTALRVILALLLLPILLFVLLTAALYIPPIQDWAVNTASRWATQGTGINITVGRVGLAFPFDIDMRRVLALGEGGDTLLCLDRTVIDLDLGSLATRQLGIDELSLHGGTAHTQDLIEGIAIDGTIGTLSVSAPHGIDLAMNRVNVGSVTLEGCDLAITLGEMPEDTTVSAPLPWYIAVRQAGINTTTITLVTDSLWARAAITHAAASKVSCDLKQESYAVAALALAGEAQLCMPALSTDTMAVAPIDIAMSNAQCVMRNEQCRIQLEDFAAQVLHSSLSASLTASLPSDTADKMHYDGSASASIDRRDILWALAAVGEDTMSLRRMLPPLTLECEAQAHDADLAATASLVMGGRNAATAQGCYNIDTETYKAHVSLNRLSPRAFVRSLPIGPVTATVNAEGQGFDPYSLATRMTARAEVKRCLIDSIDLRDVCMAATYNRRQASLLLDCNNPLVNGNLSLAATLLKRGDTEAHLKIDINNADLYGLRLVEKPLQMAATIQLDAHSDLRSRLDLTGLIANQSQTTPDTVFHSKDITLDAIVHTDTMAAHISAGDLTMGMTAGCGINELSTKATAFIDTLSSQLAQYRLDQERLRTMLPRAEVRLAMGNDNPAAHIAQAMGYGIDAFRLRLGADPTIGLNGGIMFNRLSVGGVTLDEMWCNIYQDTTGVKMDARVHNTPRNPQISFDARANAYILPSGAGLHLTYNDNRGRRGVDIGSEVDILPDGIRLHITPLNPILATRHFEANADNYIFMAPDGRVSADLTLQAHDGTGIRLRSLPQDTTAVDSSYADMPATLQDITLSMQNVNVAELCNIMPYMPRMTGTIYGDAHLVQTTQTMSVAIETNVDALTYEGAEIGDIMLNATYLPVGDSCHYVDAMLMLDGEDIAVLTGHYTDDGLEGLIDAEASLTHLPLAVIGRLAGDPATLTLGGDMDGTISVSGAPAQPRIDGFIATDGVVVASPAYNVNMRVRDDTVSIVANRLRLGGIDMYSTGRNPLTVDGWIDFSDPSHVSLDTRLSAKRFELINAKRTVASLAYGKVLVDADATLRGTLERLTMQGKLAVLGGTDVTYILQDGPLTVEDRLADLVTFTDFNDTIPHDEPEEATSTALTMRMAVNVEESARVHCLLSPDRTSYVDLEGGGDLMLGYTPQGDISLTGRYTIVSGEMKYALPVIPLKTFHLQSGSYVAWNGNMLNPTLDITATERVKAAVSSETGANRSVAFDVGVAITQTLENMGLAFTVDAPEDATIQNELQAMDAAARGRVAVTMLATGMYITDTGSSGGFSTTNALGSFLQSEISNITGRALGSLDVNVGMEEGTGRTGGQTTDYSFSFAKRFWNNRISVSFGGRVSSGADAQNTGATIIDNVAIEYRLDQSATRYVRLSYDKNYESLLEGTITEMGAGLVLRRKTTRLGELFIFRRKKKE